MKTTTGFEGTCRDQGVILTAATALASQQGNQLATRDHHAAFMQNFAPRPPQSAFDVEGFWLSVNARQQKLQHTAGSPYTRIDAGEELSHQQLQQLKVSGCRSVTDVGIKAVAKLKCLSLIHI